MYLKDLLSATHIFTCATQYCLVLLFYNVERASQQATKGGIVKFGHVTGHKKERKNSQRWYAAIQAEHLARIEREWAEREAAKAQAGTK
jgi:hypothetical protein